MAFTEIAPGVVARAKCGDEEAFHLIFNRYGRPVLSFIHNLVHDRELAEELAQETFVRAHRNLGGLRDDLRLSTWLFGIARNVARESARQARKDNMKVGLDEPESLRLESKSILPEGAMLDRELTETIQKALEVNPQSADAYNGLATVYNAQKQFDKAAEASAQAQKLAGEAGGAAGTAGGGNASTVYNQGVIAWNADKVPEAKKLFEQAVQLDPKLADAHYWLGMATLNEG